MHRIRVPEKADPTERSWRGVLRGHVPSKSPSADGEIPVPMLPGTRRRWVRKATAFRGRSEQDRSALCPACSTATLETFRWNVFNGMCLTQICGHGTPCPYRGCCETASCFLCCWGLRLQRPTGTLQKSNLSSPVSHGERSCSLPAKSCRFLSLSPCAQKYGHGDFAVCGRRLRGHVPSKNTSPTVLSWISLTGSTTPFFFVPARCFLINTVCHFYRR